MCAPMNESVFDRIRVEIARGRRAAGLDAPAVRVPDHVRPITADISTPNLLRSAIKAPPVPRSVRAVDIRTPLGRITFYVRQPVREQDNAVRRVLARAA